MRLGIGGERFRLRAGPVVIGMGAFVPATQTVVLTLGGAVLTMGGLALVVEVVDE